MRACSVLYLCALLSSSIVYSKSNVKLLGTSCLYGSFDVKYSIVSQATTLSNRSPPPRHLPLPSHSYTCIENVTTHFIHAMRRFFFRVFQALRLYFGHIYINYTEFVVCGVWECIDIHSQFIFVIEKHAVYIVWVWSVRRTLIRFILEASFTLVVVKMCVLTGQVQIRTKSVFMNSTKKKPFFFFYFLSLCCFFFDNIRVLLSAHTQTHQRYRFVWCACCHTTHFETVETIG